MQLSMKLVVPIFVLSISTQSFAFDLMHGKIPIQVGAFNASPGTSQNININGLIGDHYTVTSNPEQNVVAGLGYFVDGPDRDHYSLSYGANAFYLAKASVKGTIVQEHLYPNLGYKFQVTNVPIYAIAKAEIKNNSNKYAVTLDAGIGPNVMTTSDYKEYSLDGGFTQPDRAFSGRTNTTFSATAGVGVKMSNVFGSAPLECGYRFFYLGQGGFNKQTNQLQNTLETANSYAQALICSVTVL